MARVPISPPPRAPSRPLAAAGTGGGFVSKLNAAGSALLYSTYLCGGYGYGIAVDASGNAYVTGLADSSNFPITSGAFQTTFEGICGDTHEYFECNDVFASKFNPAGSALIYSTYVGGSLGHPSTAVDASGNIYVTGSTSTINFPSTPGAFQTTFRGGQVIVGGFIEADAFVAKISPADAPGIALGPGSLSFSSQAVGTTSAAQTVTLLDAGSLPLSITSIVASGDFGQTNTCGSALPAGTACTLSVAFTPTATGIRNGAVIITDNAPGSPHQLPLTGAGRHSGGQSDAGQPDVRASGCGDH